MRKTLVLLVVGLSRRLLGPNTPHLSAFVARGGCALSAHGRSRRHLHGTIDPADGPPTVWPRSRGQWLVLSASKPKCGSGGNQIVSSRERKFGRPARNAIPTFTCANMFWWYNMYSTVDISATPRPMYPADGRKIPDHYAEPPELRDELNQLLGTFPLFTFWGPMTSIEASRWIARATQHVRRTRQPTLTLCYLAAPRLLPAEMGARSDRCPHRPGSARHRRCRWRADRGG